MVITHISKDITWKMFFSTNIEYYKVLTYRFSRLEENGISPNTAEHSAVYGGDGSEYFYIRNLQGDVSIILDSTGEVIVQYHYDAYGNILDTTFVGLGYEEIFDINPDTYRGYRMDSETGYYYLQSRYYDSVIGRFINIDGTFGSIGEALESNLFIYGLNNPVINTDHSGYSSFSIFT